MNTEDDLVLEVLDEYLRNLTNEDIDRIEDKYKDVKYGFDLYIPKEEMNDE